MILQEDYDLRGDCIVSYLNMRRHRETLAEIHGCKTGKGDDGCDATVMQVCHIHLREGIA